MYLSKVQASMKTLRQNYCLIADRTALVEPEIIGTPIRPFVFMGLSPELLRVLASEYFRVVNE